ncbi:MAG: Fic family protein [Dehalococcoidales bacterium]
MYEPNFRSTEKLMDSLREIEEVQDLLRTIPIIPIMEERIQQEALVATVHYTTKIEGNPLDIKAVEKIGTQRFSSEHLDRPEQEVSNIYKTMDFIRNVANQDDVPIDESVVRQIHAYIVRDIPSQGHPGEYKTKQNAIADQTSKKTIFMPPNPSNTIQLMRELSAWLSRSPLAFHPVIAAGIAHLELVAIHPFDDGNGRTARALSDLILYRYGYQFRYLFSWVRQVGVNMNSYHRILRDVLGDEYGAKSDTTIWLEYFAEAISMSLAEKRPQLIEVRQTFVEGYNLGKRLGLKEDQYEALAFAVLTGDITTGEYMRAGRLSRSTAIKRLSELAEKGLLRVVGRGRSVRYVPAPEGLMSIEQHKKGLQLSLEMVKASVKK